MKEIRYESKREYYSDRDNEFYIPDWLFYLLADGDKGAEVGIDDEELDDLKIKFRHHLLGHDESMSIYLTVKQGDTEEDDRYLLWHEVEVTRGEGTPWTIQTEMVKSNSDVRIRAWLEGVAYCGTFFDGRGVEGMWVTEHGMSYRIPDAILALVEEGRIVDQSWHNDVAPKFSIGTLDGRGDSGETPECYLWVEHPEPDEREMSGFRFAISIGSSALGCDGSSTIINTDDLSEVLDTIRGIETIVRWFEHDQTSGQGKLLDVDWHCKSCGFEDEEHSFEPTDNEQHDCGEAEARCPQCGSTEIDTIGERQEKELGEEGLHAIAEQLRQETRR
jgi:predicted Zn-ribbon and HTH transcriptional regulator